MYHHNPMEEERRALFRPTSNARDFIDMARQQEAQRRYNALGQLPSAEQTGRPSSERPPPLRMDRSLSSRQMIMRAGNSSATAGVTQRHNNASSQKKTKSFWALDAEDVYDKHGRRHDCIFKRHSVYRIEIFQWMQKPQLSGGAKYEEFSAFEFEWKWFVELMVTSKLPRELQTLLDSPSVEEPEAALVSDECRFGPEYEFQAFKPEWQRRCVSESDKDDVLVSRNTLLLLLECIHWRVRLGSEEMESCFKQDQRFARQALGTAEEQAGPETDCQLFREKSFSQRICRRIQYMDRFSAWAQTQGFETTGRLFPNPEPDLDVDAFLFRTGILEQQYMRTKRQFHYKRDILCQMYGLGMHEITFVINNPNKLERNEQMQTMSLYHKLVCYLGFHMVEDITTQFAYLSYACRNLVKREFDPKLQRFTLPELREARRREFKITTILVNNVWNTKYTANGLRPMRTFSRQIRRRDGRDDIADWCHLTTPERRALFHNDTAAIRQYVPEAFIQLNAAAPAFVPASQTPTPTPAQESQTVPTPEPQASKSASWSPSPPFQRFLGNNRKVCVPWRQVSPPLSPPLSLEDIGEFEHDQEEERYWTRQWHRRLPGLYSVVVDDDNDEGDSSSELDWTYPSPALESLKMCAPIRQPQDPTEDVVPAWRNNMVHPIRQPIGPSPGQAPTWIKRKEQPIRQLKAPASGETLAWRPELLQPIRQPQRPFSRVTQDWRRGAPQPMEQPEMFCPQAVRTTSFDTCIDKLSKAIQETEAAQRGWEKMVRMMQNGLPLNLGKAIQEDPDVLAAIHKFGELFF